MPPDIELAKVHEKAFKVGKHPVESVNRCLCCNTSRDYELIPLNCDIKELRYINYNYINHKSIISLIIIVLIINKIILLIIIIIIVNILLY